MIKLISALMVYAEMEMMRRKEKDSYQVQVLNATPVFLSLSKNVLYFLKQISAYLSCLIFKNKSPVRFYA